jgi:hypothetical protein
MAAGCKVRNCREAAIDGMSVAPIERCALLAEFEGFAHFASEWVSRRDDPR